MLLVLGRAAGLVATAPVFGDRTIPTTVKAALAVALAVAFAPVAPALEMPTGFGLGLALGTEIAIGLAIGFSATLLFAGIRAGGALIDQHLGLAFSGVLDPATGEEETPVAQLKLMLALAIYVLVDGHHALVSGMLDSFRAMPAAGFDAESVVRLAGAMFGIAIKVAAPAVVALLVAGIAMAFAARTAPQVETLAAGVPVRVLVGFTVLALGAAGFAAAVAKAVGR